MKASLATRPTDGEALESERLKTRLGEMLFARELLNLAYFENPSFSSAGSS